MDGSTNASIFSTPKYSTLTVGEMTVHKVKWGHIVTYSAMNQNITTAGDFTIDNSETFLHSNALIPVVDGADINSGYIYMQGVPVIRITRTTTALGFHATFIVKNP